ncbi:MAG TPA: tyrosine-type recombinase/integrase [Terriglobia bacterium]|nr:tyrosine-type recombinase/integrase [Terriglobia bacterium]
MARQRYQSPTPRLRGNSWIITIREDVVQADGSIKRKQKVITLGHKGQIQTAKLARRMAEPILIKLNSALCRPIRPMRFSEMVERYKVSILPDMKPSTQLSQCSAMRAHLVPKFGDRYLYEIMPEMIQNYVVDMRGKVGDKTAWNILMVMRSIWRTALDWGYATERIFDHVRMRCAAPPDDPRCFSLDEVRKILARAPEPHRTFYWLAAETGMRAGELCGLRWQDVDLENGMVRVRQSSWRGRITEPKTRAGRRRFAVSAELLARLAEMYGVKKLFYELVFHSRNGTPWDANLLVKRKLQPLLERLGIAKAGLHAFRHFNASQMDRLGSPSGLARDRLGHASLMVTNRYTHSVTADDRLVASKLAGSMMGVNCYTNPDSVIQRVL